MLEQVGKPDSQFWSDTKACIFERVTKVIALFATLTDVAECTLDTPLRLIRNAEGRVSIPL